MEEKLSYKEWLKKHFEKGNNQNYWTSIYEKEEVGLTNSCLSHYKEKDLKKCYDKYSNGDEDFLSC